MALSANHNKITITDSTGEPVASFPKVKDLQIQLELCSLLNRKNTNQDGNKNVVTSQLRQGSKAKQRKDPTSAILFINRNS